MDHDATRARPIDRTELATMFERHGERLYRYCLRLLSCPDDAGDAVQDMFTNLARRRAALPDDEEGRRIYLFAVARNACFDLRRQRRPYVDLASLLERGIEIAAEQDADDPEATAVAGSTRAQLERALERLPERQCAAWILRERAGLSYDEIASRLALNPNAVAQLLHRARRTLLATPEIQALRHT
jgi:RNA polymerase sigma-70 factor (ECF subfamily)